MCTAHLKKTQRSRVNTLRHTTNLSLIIDYNFLQTSMNALLLETMVGVSTSVSTQWAATTVTVQQDSLYPWMRERVKVGRKVYMTDM